MIKCLIIDPAHPSIIPLLEKIGVSPDYRPDITKEEVYDILGDYEGLIVRSKMKLDEKLLAKGEKLKFIARAGAGVDQIAADVLEKRQIKLFNAPEGNRDAVGEHTVGMLLCLLNKMHLANLEIRKKQWRREENRGYEIKGKTVGLIGYGNMGKAVAKRLSGFGCEVIAYDIRKNIKGDENGRLVSKEELFEKTDILSLHIPLNDFNRALIDEAYLSGFKKNIYLINMARGEVLPFKAIRKALESGKVIGAALDVLENEKLDTLTPEQSADFDYLCSCDNVLLTPHVGGWTFESYNRINEVLVEKIDIYLKALESKS
ncbi:NAD(P)-dependent oxidoreductase [Flexithrix dorotheae]|uniref:NAD(P)-dependent oxidoreductase n=1 Tax=Flexithrix dorotheae TaxID=70993 RepID=UPI0003676D9D|nr:NAD(P)-dependent oxidoreductase [Flexithrix dorotheae]